MIVQTSNGTDVVRFELILKLNVNEREFAAFAVHFAFPLSVDVHHRHRDDVADLSTSTETEK
jgi:hypothetical protein